MKRTLKSLELTWIPIKNNNFTESKKICISLAEAEVTPIKKSKINNKTARISELKTVATPENKSPLVKELNEIEINWPESLS